MKLTVSENFRAAFYAPFYAIRALGFAAREGLDIEWLPGERPGGALQQVKTGRIDAMWGGPMRVIAENDAGAVDDASLVSFAEVVGRDPFYVIGPGKENFQLKDLAVMRLGVVSEVETPWYCLRADLEDAGVDTKAMKLTTGLTMPRQLEALAAGKLDAVQCFEPYASQALASGNEILYAAASRGPCVYTTFYTARATAQKRGAELAALTRATQAMLDWLAAEGPDALARTAAPFFPGLPESLLREAYARYHANGLWSRSATVSAAGFERLEYSMHKGGYIKRRHAYAECVQNFD